MSFRTLWLRGETRRIEISCVDSDGEAEDLDVATGLEFELKTTTGAADPALIRKFIGTGIVLQDQTAAATKGKATLTIDSADTSGSGTPAGVYYADIVLIMPGSPPARTYVLKPTRIVLEDVVNQP